MMQALDGTIATVALPHMAASLTSSQDQASWVLTSYIVATAIATPLTGWLAARFGTKTLFIAAILGFTTASVLCGLAASMTQLVAFRVLQGAFGAMLVPLSQTVLLTVHSREKHGQAMAWWGVGAMVGPILGPSLGGWITEAINWRWIFLINLPVGLFAAWGLWIGLRADELAPPQRFDVIGFVTLACAVGLLQLVLDRGERMAWFESIGIRFAAMGCLVALLCFLAHTALSRSPTFFNYRLLLDANYTSCLTFMFLIGLVLFATRALTAPMLQTVLGYSIELNGLIAIPAGIGTMLAMLIAGRFIGRANLAGVMTIGFALVAVSLMQMSYFTTEVMPAQVAWPGFIQGLGLGLVSVSLTTVAFSTLDPALRTDGASTLNLLRNLGASLGISIMQTLLTRSTIESHAALVSELGERHAITSAAGYLSNDVWAADVEAQIEQLAAMAGYTSDFRLMAVTTLAVMPLLLLLRVRK